MNRKYMETLLDLLREWFENRQQLANYDYEMLKRLATISLNETTEKRQHNDEDNTERFK